MNDLGDARTSKALPLNAMSLRGSGRCIEGKYQDVRTPVDIEYTAVLLKVLPLI